MTKRFRIILFLIFVLLISLKELHQNQHEYAYQILRNPKSEHDPHHSEDFSQDNIALDKLGVYYGKAIGADFILPNRLVLTTKDFKRYSVINELDDAIEIEFL